VTEQPVKYFTQRVEEMILTLRGQKVILDTDLARMARKFSCRDYLFPGFARHGQQRETFGSSLNATRLYPAGTGR
jgi:hypothetical protein